MRYAWLSTLVGLSALLGCGGPPLDRGKIQFESASGDYVLVWEEDFSGPAGSALSPEWWRADVGGSGWGNAQLEYNTDSTGNAALDGDGNLVLTARAEEFGGNGYTSARWTTATRFEVEYGRIEARIRVPSGQGIWPAFWMLGGNIGEVGWPACGEIDILEVRGQEPNRLIGSIHGPGYSAGNAVSAVYEHPQSLADDFHVYAIEWSPGRIDWYLDDTLYHSVLVSSLPNGAPWVFDHPFFLIVNVAVGGHFVGSPDATTVFPAQMVIDYIRVSELQ